jgi:hypothetical protein
MSKTVSAIFAPLHQTPQSIGEIVAAKELGADDLTRCEILNLSDLLDQTVARHKAAWRTELLHRPNRHLFTQESQTLQLCPRTGKQGVGLCETGSLREHADFLAKPGTWQRENGWRRKAGGQLSHRSVFHV